jgi:uncharacterized cupin superfamily protein
MSANVYGDQEWNDWGPIPPGWCTRSRSLVPGRRKLNMSLYELQPGETQLPYHFHHGAEELLIVLGGRPTLRTPEGERELAEGEAVHFPSGPAGAHQVLNGSDAPARYVVAAASTSPEVVEYPDSRRVLAAARSEGGPIWTMHRLENEIDFWDDEQPRSWK